MWALFVAQLLGGLAMAMGTLAGRALLALGIGFVSYQGIDLGVQSLAQNIITSFQGLPAQLVRFLAFMWIDKAITVLISAVTVALSFKVMGGTIKKMVFK
jgi:hypothetical protein